MCGRYQYDFSKPEQLKLRFSIDGDFPKNELKARYNASPGQKHPVIVENKNGTSIQLMTWSYLPSYLEKELKPWGLANIKVESAEKWWAKKSFQFERCIVPANGFYEPKGPKTMKNRPQYYFKKKDNDLFALAGVFREFTSLNGQKLLTYAIITTTPNKTVGAIHDRSPLMLNKESEKVWLNPDNSEIGKLLTDIKTTNAEEIEYWHVSDRVKNPRNDDSELIKPIKI